MSDILKYYQDYQGHDGYKMEKWKHTSRVEFIKQYIKQLTPVNGSILDVGCGDMYLANQLPNYKWVGLDADNRYSNGRAIKHDLAQVPYPIEANSVDTVICSEVLEHLWEPKVAIREAFRTLKHGGYYIISTPNFNNHSWLLDNHKPVLFKGTFSHHYEHIRWYTREVLQEFLEEAGFKLFQFTGADAIGVEFFQDPIVRLYHILHEILKVKVTEVQVDQIVSEMFKEHCATIILIGKKEKSG